MIAFFVTAVVSIILFGIFLKIHSRHKKPLKAAVVNMILGVLSLSIFAPIVSLSVNLYTVFAALTLGLPGTVFVILMKILLPQLNLAIFTCFIAAILR